MTQFQLRENQKKQLLGKIDAIPEVKSARVVYFDGANISEIRPHPPICKVSYRTVVIRQVNREDVRKINHPTPKSNQEDNRFYSELLNTSLSCGAAVLSWIVVGSSAAVIPVSGGTSTAITILTYGAATASSLQCANSAYRLYNESSYGDPEVTVG